MAVDDNAVLVPDLQAPANRHGGLQLDAVDVAAKHPGVTKCDTIHPARWQALYERNRYAAVIRSRDLLFVSGQVGSREDGSPEPDFTEQVRLAFRNLAAVLEAAGCTFADIVDVISFHTDPEAQLEATMAVREEALAGAPVTNWTAVGVNWLAGFDFEIRVVARVPSAA